jgi:hypothetical protein
MYQFVHKMCKDRNEKDYRQFSSCKVVEDRAYVKPSNRDSIISVRS